MSHLIRSVTSFLLLASLICLTIFSCTDHVNPPEEPDVAETVYVGSFDGKLYALNATTGAKKWEYPIEIPAYFAPTVANGIVYMGAGKKLYAVDATTGSKKWEVAFVDPNNFGAVRSVPTVINGLVYVSVADGLTNINKLSALDAVTGTVKWEFPIGTGSINSPTVANGIVYIGIDSKLIALDALTGAKKWEVMNLQSGTPTNSSVVDGVIYTNFGISIYAHDAITGIQKWASNTSGAGSLTVENGLIFFKGKNYNGISGNSGRDLYVINATTGKYINQYYFSWEGNSSPVAVNGIVYVGSGGAQIISGTFTLHAIDALTATKKWVQNFQTPIRTSPTVAAGIVFVSGSGLGSKSSTIYALDAVSGSIKWEASPLLTAYDYTAACVVTKKGVVYHPSDSGDQQ